MAAFDWLDEDEEYDDMLTQQARDMARFCLATGVQPSEYLKLTLLEINEFIKEVNRQSKKKGA